MIICWGMGGGGVPWGRRQCVGIHFCHPEVVKVQQQCHTQNIIFDQPQVPAGYILFLSGRGRVPISWERESANILGEGECQYPGRGRVPISWVKESANILGEGECQYPGKGRVPISWRQQQGIGRKNENDNPVRKWNICSSIITLMFGLNMNFGYNV